ncbi:MAG: MCE family protein [Akkermansiaceae bacterium]|nr:MCE family protein [Verrucomicrobiales bacterium]
MALQDLTPQLRTRLNRMERAVGWFVLAAAVLLIAGFAYYLRSTAQRKGWFLQKITYQTCVSSGAGLKIGDPVKLMGFDVGEITHIIPNEPREYYNITLKFRVIVNEYNYPGYIWSDSKAKVNAGDLLGGRFLEITKGAGGLPTIRQTTNVVGTQVLREKFVEERQKEQFEELKKADVEEAKRLERPPKGDDVLMTEVWEKLKGESATQDNGYYTNLSAETIYFLTPLESPSVTERLQNLVDQVEQALPNILGLTNKIAAVLGNTANLTSNLNVVAESVQPAVANFSALAAQLRGPGALGEWVLGTNGQQNLEATLANANQTIANTDTNLNLLFENLAQSLDNLAGITSNLNVQVQANTNMLGSISKAVVDADDLVQGLKRHWLLRSAFKKKPDAKTAPPTTSPKQRGR